MAHMRGLVQLWQLLLLCDEAGRRNTLKPLCSALINNEVTVIHGDIKCGEEMVFCEGKFKLKRQVSVRVVNPTSGRVLTLLIFALHLHPSSLGHRLRCMWRGLL